MSLCDSFLIWGNPAVALKLCADFKSLFLRKGKDQNCAVVQPLCLTLFFCPLIFSSKPFWQVSDVQRDFNVREKQPPKLPWNLSLLLKGAENYKLSHQGHFYSFKWNQSINKKCHHASTFSIHCQKSLHHALMMIMRSNVYLFICSLVVFLLNKQYFLARFFNGVYEPWLPWFKRKTWQKMSQPSFSIQFNWTRYLAWNKYGAFY